MDARPIGATGRFANHVVVDWDLAERAQHETESNGQCDTIRQARHQGEEDDLDQGDNHIHVTWTVTVEHTTDYKLRDGGNRENHKDQRAYNRRQAILIAVRKTFQLTGQFSRQALQPLVKNLRQGESRRLKDDRPDRRGHEDNYCNTNDR